jgi:hypothetical protein
LREVATDVQEANVSISQVGQEAPVKKKTHEALANHHPISLKNFFN